SAPGAQRRSTEGTHSTARDRRRTLSTLPPIVGRKHSAGGLRWNLRHVARLLRQGFSWSLEPVERNSIPHLSPAQWPRSCIYDRRLHSYGHFIRPYPRASRHASRSSAACEWGRRFDWRTFLYWTRISGGSNRLVCRPVGRGRTVHPNAE